MNLMRRACAESGHAFAAAMQSTKPGLSQHQLEAIVEFHTRVRGARQLGYPPVVASGIDNNTLHYVSNDEILRYCSIPFTALCHMQAFLFEISLTRYGGVGTVT